MNTVSRLSILLMLFSHCISVAQSDSVALPSLNSLRINSNLVHIGDGQFSNKFRSMCYSPWIELDWAELKYFKTERMLHLEGVVVNGNGEKYSIEFARIKVGHFEECYDSISTINIGDEEIDYNHNLISHCMHTRVEYIAGLNGEFSIDIYLYTENDIITFLLPKVKMQSNDADSSQLEEVDLITCVKVYKIGEYLNY